MIAISVLLAVLLDIIFAEPKRFHPLVGFGWMVNRVESRVNSQDHPRLLQFFTGAMSWLLLVVLPTFLIILLVTYVESTVDVFSAVVVIFFEAVFLYLAIGYTSLRQHAMAIVKPLVDGDIVSAREKVGWIVSRDTDQINDNDVRKATIESVLENGSDAVFAPIFWFVVGGFPAVILYRLSNTLDAMWGYKTDRFLYFGRFSARMDDVLNYMPSRLVAISYASLGQFLLAVSCWRKQAPLLASPNAGVVMTSGAGALDVSLGGDAYYHGELTPKPVFGGHGTVTNDDIFRALRLIDKTLILWCIVIVALT
ncbi:MAG: adenosylcobinamide-phosphate synthase [Candidatus Endobugula sp.]|jgi:adenosylcobinamide-phosphate synthase